MSNNKSDMCNNFNQNTPKRRGRRKKNASFNPDRSFIASAVEDYLKGGGKVTRMEQRDEEERYKKLLNQRGSLEETDSFLIESDPDSFKF